MEPTLHVHVLRGELSDPANAARLRSGLRGALDRVLAGALRACGVDPTWDVAIRALEVEIDEAAGEEAWAQAILAGVGRAVGGLRPGEANEHAAVFPGRVAAGLAALRQVERAGATPWWWVSLVGSEEASVLQSAVGWERVACSWIDREPASATAGLVTLFVEGLAPRGSVGGGHRVLRALLEERAGRQAVLGVTGRALEPAGLAGPSVVADDRAAPTAAASSAERAAEVLSLSLSAREREVLWRLPPEEALLFAVCLALERAPGLADPRGVGAALVHRRSEPALRSAPGVRSQTAAKAPLHKAHEEPVPVGPPSHGEASGSRPLAPSVPDAAQELAVGLGGLLFLSRWLVRDALASEGPLAPRLATFAALVLECVLSPLAPVDRVRIVREHRLLLQVFVGEASLAPDAGQEDAARAALDRLRGALPSDLIHRPASLAWTFRSLAAPLDGIAAEDRALALLLLRPGRLRVGPHRADLWLSPECVDPALRRGGWDIDPGWFPPLGRVIRFHYQEGP